MDDNGVETKQERREKKLQKRKERVAKHGKNLAHLYKEAILKRIGRLRNQKEKGKEV